jgi:hypothetical protein
LLLAQGVLFKLVFYVQRASDAFFKCETLFGLDIERSLSTKEMQNLLKERPQIVRSD